MVELNKWPGPDYSTFRYMMDLIKILDKESDRRIVKKIKKLKTKEAKAFLAEWQRLYCLRIGKLKHLCITNIEECNQVIEIVCQEYRHLGIRIP